ARRARRGRRPRARATGVDACGLRQPRRSRLPVGGARSVARRRAGAHLPRFLPAHARRSLSPNPNPLRGRPAVVVFACFAAGYFLSFALRSVNAVIAPELTREFGLSNAELGSLSAAYFLGFSL